MRVHVITMGFAPARILEQGIGRLYETRNVHLPIHHYLVDQHYPLKRAENRAGIEALCLKHGITLLDPGRDMGLHNGFNWATDQIKPESGDIIIGYDPDAWPVESGWDMALVTALAHGGFSVMGVMTPAILHELKTRGHDRLVVNGHVEVLESTRQACMLSISAFTWDFLRACGGLSEPNAFYGGLESVLWVKLRQQKRRWGYLAGYYEDTFLNHQSDIEYYSWKRHHAHTGFWPGSFESYVAAGCPRLVARP